MRRYDHARYGAKAKTSAFVRHRKIVDFAQGNAYIHCA